MLNKRPTVEFALLGLCLAAQAWHFFPLLAGWTTIAHDNLTWNYPVFVHYFTELSRGHLPVFNYYSRFGEPFVPDAAQMRFWDPFATVLGVALTKFLPDREQAFNCFRYLMALAQSLGIYFCFRRLTNSLLIRFFLMVNVLFTSIFFGSFQQDGILNQFLWIPLIVGLLQNHFIERRAGVLSCLALGVLIGSSFQSYFFLIPGLFLVLYIVLTLLAGEKIESFFPLNGALARVALVALPLLPMAMLNFTSRESIKAAVFPARTAFMDNDRKHIFDPERLESSEKSHDSLLVSENIRLDSGTSSRFWDYIQLFSPISNPEVNLDKKHAFGEPSEAVMVFPVLTVILGFIGLGVARDKRSLVWLNVLAIFFILGLGDEAHVFPWLVTVIPAFGFIRHTHCFIMYVEFAFMYFMVTGGDFAYRELVEKLEKIRP